MSSNPFSRSAPRRSANRPGSRARGQDAGAPSRVRLMSSEEKRQLILAHAARRQPLDRLQAFSLWAGIFICVITVALGWVYAAHRQVVYAVWQGNDVVKQATDGLETDVLHEELGRVRQEWGSALQETVQRLDAMQTERQQELETVNTMAEKIHTSASNTVRGSDLFQAPMLIPSNAEGLKLE